MAGSKNQSTSSSSAATSTAAASTGSSNPKKQPSKNKAKATTDSTVLTTQQQQSAAAESKKEETMYEILMNHPFLYLLSGFLLYYGMKYTYFYIILKHPEQFSNTLRPAVRLHNERQVLLLGSFGSGIDRIADGLSNLLRYEIGIESYDAESFFVRDGLISNFLAIRYLPLPKDSAIHVQLLVTELCISRDKEANNAFNPVSNYRPNNNCSTWDGWQKCHSQVCVKFMLTEWGCAVREPTDKSIATNRCETVSTIAPVRRTIYVVQHPVTIIQELVSSVCTGNFDETQPMNQPRFRQVTIPWVNEIENSITKNSTTNSTETVLSCIGYVSWYVVNYNLQMVNAVKKGLVHPTIIKYEDNTLCNVAHVAGFYSNDTAVYQPNVMKYSNKCNRDTTTGSFNDEANLLLPDMNHKTVINKDTLPILTWKKFYTAGGQELVDALKLLCKELSYSTLVLEEGEFEEETTTKTKTTTTAVKSSSTSSTEMKQEL